MKAVIMAAGVGTRISNKITGPKSTLEIMTPKGKMPLIRYTVERLVAKGIDVAIVTGYMPGYIQNVLSGLPVTYYENPFYSVTNSMASLWFARDWLDDEDTILMNADVYWTDGIIDKLLESKYTITMLGDISRIYEGDYFFKLSPMSTIEKYGKELTVPERSTEYVGIALVKSAFIPVFKRHLDEMVNSGKYVLWWENVLYEYINLNPVYVMDVDGEFWAEIDYIEDYHRIVEFTSNK